MSEWIPVVVVEDDELKHNPQTEQIPVFMPTSKGMTGDLDRSFETGADDHIIKFPDMKSSGKIVKHIWKNMQQVTQIQDKAGL